MRPMAEIRDATLCSRDQPVADIVPNTQPRRILAVFLGFSLVVMKKRVLSAMLGSDADFERPICL